MIEAKKLSKKFISTKKKPGLLGALESLVYREQVETYAVRDYDLQIEEGEVIGLLGPNGAGKTTLMKMFTGIIVPSSGELKILGHKPSDRALEFRKNIALIMGQKSQLWWDIPAMDSFLLLQRYYEVSDQAFKERVGMMAELLGVEKLLQIHVRRLSLGERMKMELMASLLHSPKVIFLDEPTIGLDLMAQENIRQFLLNYHQQNKTTLILTSHYMADVQALCKRLVLIFDGKKAYDGAIKDFERILGNDKSVTFNFSSSINQRELLEKYTPQWNEDFTQVEVLVPESELRELSLSVLEQWPVVEFATEKMPIEKVMKTLMNNPQILRSIQP
jgi:ABC-2 type transport system ATP-binding protein